MKRVWDGTSRLSGLATAIQDYHIPPTGRCDNIVMEAYRCMGTIYYDYYNNGMTNVADDPLEIKLLMRHGPKTDVFTAFIKRAERLARRIAFYEDDRMTDEEKRDFEALMEKALDDIVLFTAEKIIKGETNAE